MVASYPTLEEFAIKDLAINPQVLVLQELVTAVRNLRAEMNLNPSLKVPLVIELKGKLDTIQEFIPYLESLAKLSEVKIVSDLGNEITSIAILHGMRLMLEVEVDKSVERIRLSREIEKLTKELDKIKVKLDNEEFIKRAPKDLIERDTLRADELSGKISQFKAQLTTYV